MASLQVHPHTEQLQAFFEGKLDAAEAEQIEQHLADCADCLRLLQGCSDGSMAQLAREAMQSPAPVEDDQTVVSISQSAEQADTRVDTSGTAGDGTPGRGTPATDVPVELAEHPRYRIEKVLGQGGMGAVYLAEHLRMQRKVALKVIRPGLMDATQAVPRFLQEVRAAARLSHPNIVRAYDADQAGDLHFLVMEYVEGIDLARMIQAQGPLSVALACSVIRQAALGLHHAHEQGMVHRDIKPHNLMVTRTDQVKILDFGLAGFARDRERQVDGAQLTASGTIMGTADYIAPEQTRDAGRVDIRADIYSLGCTLYQALSGRVPFTEGSHVDKMLRHALDAPPALRELRPDLPGELIVIVEKMMAKKPDDRYATPADVAQALAPFVVGEEPSARAAEWGVPEVIEQFVPFVEERPRRQPVWVPLLLSLGVVVLLLAGVVYRVMTDNGEVVVTAESPDVEVTFLKGGKEVRILDTKTNKKVTLPTGEYTVAVNKPDEFRITTDVITIRRGTETLVTIERKPRELPGPGVRPIVPGRVGLSHTLVLPRDESEIGAIPSPDGKYLAVQTTTLNRSQTPDRLVVMETAGGKVVRTFDSPGRWFTSVAFLPDHRLVTCTVMNAELTRYDIWIRNIATGESRRIEGYPPVREWVHRLLPSSDGKVCVVYSGNEIIVCQTETGKELSRFQAARPDLFQGLSGFTPDGRHLVAYQKLPDVEGKQRGRFAFLEAATGRSGRTLEIASWTDPAIVFQDGGRTLVIPRHEKGRGYAAEFLDLATGKSLRLQTFGAADGLDAMYLVPGGRLGILRNLDQRIRIYDLANGRELYQSEQMTGTGIIRVSPDGSQMYLAQKELLHVFRLSVPEGKPE